MTLDQIDQALSEWRARLALAGGNLLDMDGIAAYQRLRGGAGQPPAALTGVTQARVAPALAAIDSLWQSLQRLTEVIKKAEGLRAPLSRLWPHEGERRQIEFLLTGESVPLPPVEEPFARRGLLSVAEQAAAITPDRLLARMTQDFAVAKDAVLALENAWNGLEPRMAAADRDAAALQALADRLGVDSGPEMDGVRREIAALHDRIGTDPLGVGATPDSQLTPLLERTRTRLVALAEERDRLDADLRRAQSLLAELGALQQTCQSTLAECRDKIEAAPAAVPVIRADLPAWLQSVEAARRQQQWKPARIGLERWREAAEAARKGLSDWHAVGMALLERREELRGLLSALQAKARAQATRGIALDPSLPSLARDAEQLLHGCPTPLERAAALVGEYERRLLSG